ncbi:MAG: carboxypeptidase regulatory-like domain-containing protein [Acidobacteriota bacterium]|nr:carboxypeptidase regulatory-like domain-containing protein [Acidobacteriota bacterium]
MRTQSKSVWNFLGLLAFAILVSMSLGSDVLAQTTSSATLRGTVTDPNGAVVPNANVTLTFVSTQTERKAKTSSDGVYAFTSLIPGNYTLTVEASSFKKAVKTDINLSPNETRGLDVEMAVGATSETVTITASAAEEIKTETGERSNTIKAAQIENLSIISRNSLELLRILPGVVAPDSSTYQVSGYGDASSYQVNGQRGQNNNVSVDGSRVIDIGCNCGSIVSLNNDFVQEVTIQSSNFAAEHGNSGVQISGTTKSGGKEFHGSLYNYTRHEALGANDRFRNYIKAGDPNSLAGQKPVGRFYYPGGTISGPIYLPKKVFGPLGGFNKDRDKLFFFVGFEVQRQTFGAPPRISNVPTASQRAGNFSDLLEIGRRVPYTIPGDAKPNDTICKTVIGQSVCGILGADLKTITGDYVPIRVPGNFPGAGNRIASANVSPYINPIGRILLNLYPASNFNDPTGRFNYISNTIQTQHRKDLKMRFDYKPNDKTNIYVRLTREPQQEVNPYGIWWGPSTFELPSANIQDDLGRSVAVGMTSVINPTMTNEVVFSGSKLTLDNRYADPDKVKLSTLGIENIWRLPFDNTRFGRQSPFVSLSLISWAQGQLWSPGTNPIFAWNDSFSVTDNLSKVVGSHTLKFGALIEQGNKRQNFQGDPDSQGLIGFNNWNGQGTGNDWGDLLVGQLTDVQHGTQPPIGNYRFYNYEFYAQDSWKVKPNLTVEYGLRATHMTINKERKGFDILFSPQAYRRGAGYYINGDPFRPNGVLSAARGEIQKGAIDPPAVEWGPRLNIAWSPLKDDKLVIRGGAGLFYNRVQGNFQYDATLRAAPNGNVGASIGPFTSIPGALKPDGSLYNFSDLGGLTLSNMGAVTLPNGQRVLVDPLRLANGGAAIISPDPNSNDFPTTLTTSLSVATRLPFQTVLETAYVGTFGRHLAARLPINTVPLGALLRGNIAGDNGSTITTLANPNCDPGEINSAGAVVRRGNCQIVPQTGVRLDLSNPLHRQSLGDGILNSFRPFPDLGSVRYQQYTGTSNYHSLQTTLSRQAGKNLQFFATYTFSKVLGTRGGEFNDLDPLDTRGRSYGVLDYDRTHIFNLSYNYNLPNFSPSNNAFAKGLLNGWQMSGITSWSSGTPVNLRFTGDITNLAVAAFGSDAFQSAGYAAGAIAPTFSKNPNLSGKNVGERVLDLGAIGIPAFGTTGPTISPFYFRTPNRQNWDISVFKNFKIKESKNLQFRAGFFNVFNQAFAKNIDNQNASNSDIYLTLETVCRRTAVNRPLVLADGSVVSFTQQFPDGRGGTQNNKCDPAGGFDFSAATKANFGKITTKRGQRVIELALKFTF